LYCRQQACEHIAAGDSVEQAAPHCKDPSRSPDPSTLRRWAHRRLLSVCCWVKAGAIGRPINKKEHSDKKPAKQAAEAVIPKGNGEPTDRLNLGAPRQSSTLPILTFLAETREYVSGELRNGDRPTDAQIARHLESVFAALPPGLKTIQARAD